MAPDRLEWHVSTGMGFAMVIHFGAPVAQVMANMEPPHEMQVTSLAPGYNVTIADRRGHDDFGGRITLLASPEIAEAWHLARQWTELCAA